MISSQDIIFASGDGLRPGVDAEIVVDWPRLLDRIRLQLVLRVTIIGSQDNVTEARILGYDFRTAGPREAKQRAKGAGLAKSKLLIDSSAIPVYAHSLLVRSA